MFYTTENCPKMKYNIGDYVRIRGGGALVGIVVDFWSENIYILAFPDKSEYVFPESNLYSKK